MVKLNQHLILNLKIAIAVFVTGVLLIFSGVNVGQIGYVLSLPSFAIIIGPVFAIIIVIYLNSITLTYYDKIIKNNFKETVLIAGLSGTFIGLHFMAQTYVPDILSMGQIQRLWGGYSASLITTLYSVAVAFLFIESSIRESNIEPDKSCFQEIEEKKSVNLRFFIGQLISYFLVSGSILYALYVEGAEWSLSDLIFNLPSFIFILVVFTLTAMKTGFKDYFKTFRILFYDEYGEYKIRETSLSICSAKEFIVSITILILFVFFVISLNMNLGETFYLIKKTSSILIYLFILYQLIVIQDVLILQNSILNDRFHEYTYQNNSSRIYVLIAICLGILSLIFLLNLIRA